MADGPLAGLRVIDLTRMLAAREAMYRRADAIVDTSGETPQQSFAKLRDVVASTLAVS